MDGQEPFASGLEAMLHDPDVPVRVAAIETLLERKNDDRTAPLNTALNDEVPELRFAAATALLRLHHPAGRDFLIQILYSERLRE